jgi:membrane protein YdbS with pleckstrin-like domain
MQLGQRAILYFLVRKGSAWLALGVLVALALTAALGGYPLALQLMAIPALILVILWVACFIRVRSYRFDMVAQGITLEKGLLSKSHETLLFQKIQDIVIRRSVLERLFGLSTLVIQNAMGQPEVIPGLDAREAMEFRDEILRRVTSSDRAAR